jgi:hypothetical protein
MLISPQQPLLSCSWLTSLDSLTDHAGYLTSTWTHPNSQQLKGGAALDPCEPCRLPAPPCPTPEQVVALGNLLPQDSGVDELDSYMYQTVGPAGQWPDVSDAGCANIGCMYLSHLHNKLVLVPGSGWQPQHSNLAFGLSHPHHDSCWHEPTVSIWLDRDQHTTTCN